VNIVILDTQPSNPGDISWGPLETLGALTTYELSPPETIIDRVIRAEVIITNKCKLTAEIIRALPNLKLICATATGHDNIDSAAAREQGIAVCNVPAYSTASTAQTSIALLLELTQHCGLHSEAVHAGEWTSASAFCFWKTPLIELAGKNMLLIGSGNIGTAVGRIAAALGMNVRSAILPGRPAASGGPFERVTLDEALPDTDVLSLHCPAMPETADLLNAKRIALLPDGAIVVNAARGTIVDEDALIAALRSGKLAAAGLDVYKNEPDIHPGFAELDNVFLLPHVGSATKETRDAMGFRALDNLDAFFAGREPGDRVA